MAKRPRTVVRSAKTGRFVKSSASKFNPSATVVESVKVGGHSVEMARSAKTGRFVKSVYAKRNPSKTVIQSIKRGKKG